MRSAICGKRWRQRVGGHSDMDAAPSNLRSQYLTNSRRPSARWSAGEEHILFPAALERLTDAGGWPFAIKAMRLATPMPAWARLGSGHGDQGRVARRVRLVALGPGRAAGGRHPSVGRTVDGRADRPDAAPAAPSTSRSWMRTDEACHFSQGRERIFQPLSCHHRAQGAELPSAPERTRCSVS